MRSFCLAITLMAALAAIPLHTDAQQCGNGMREPSEECDGTDLGGQTCATVGFLEGNLACSASCTFDTIGCCLSRYDATGSWLGSYSGQLSGTFEVTVQQIGAVLNGRAVFQDTTLGTFESDVSGTVECASVEFGLVSILATYTGTAEGECADGTWVASTQFGVFRGIWSACRVAPTPTATATATQTIPGPKTTPSPTASSTSTSTPTATPDGPVLIEIGTTRGRPGEMVRVDVTLRTGGERVSGILHDMSFSPLTQVAAVSGSPDCQGSADTASEFTFFGFQPPDCTPGISCTGIRALVFSRLDDVSREFIPFADGAQLYSCNVSIDLATVPNQTLPLVCSNPQSTNPEGTELFVTTCTDGAIEVEGVTCAGDAECDDDNPCTADTCSPAGACAHERAGEGMPCGDAGTCLDGQCVPEPPTPRADLELLTACRPIPPCPDGTVSCDIHVYNRGPTSAPEVTVTMNLTGDLEIVTPVDPLKVFASSASAGVLGMGGPPMVSGEQIQWTVTNVPPGGKTATWFTLRVGNTGSEKTVTVTGSADDPDPDNNMATNSIVPDATLCPPDNFAQKSGDGPGGGPAVCPTESLFYVIVFQHPGASTADLVDTLDPCLDITTVSALMPPMQCGVIDRTITCTGLGLDAGGRGQISFAVKPRLECPLGTLIRNEAQISFDDGVRLTTNPTVHEVVGCERICNDGRDDDGDGDADCADPDCQDRPCDDGSACTVRDQCNDRTCTGQAACDACSTCDPVLGCGGTACTPTPAATPTPTDTPPEPATPTDTPTRVSTDTPPPASTATPSPSATSSPTRCIPPPCGPGETLHCPIDCPAGCGVICATPTPTGETTLDHFQCYGVDPQADSRRRTVTLSDQLESKRARVLRPLSVCVPVNKNGEGIHDSAAQLTCYRIKEHPAFTGADIHSTNQFGEEDLHLMHARQLCVPSTRNGTTTELDHFKCYTAATRANAPRFERRQVHLRDEFEARTATVRRPLGFCNPVDKNGEGIINPAGHLECYDITDFRRASHKRSVHVSNQFGDQTLTIDQPSLLCVPSQKTLLP